MKLNSLETGFIKLNLNYLVLENIKMPMLNQLMKHTMRQIPKQTSKKIGVSAQFVYRLIKRYKLPTKKFGKVYTIENKNLKNFFKNVLFISKIIEMKYFK